MNLIVLFGTESGTAEMIAEELGEHLEAGHAVTVEDMASFDPSSMTTDAIHLIVCSTYGDGELPRGAFPFFRHLQQAKPDLAGVRYAMFGLGDSGYVYSYSQGSEAIDRALAERGALRIGPYGRHDAADETDPTTAAKDWAEVLLAAEAATAH